MLRPNFCLFFLFAVALNSCSKLPVPSITSPADLGPAGFAAESGSLNCNYTGVKSDGTPITFTTFAFDFSSSNSATFYGYDSVPVVIDSAQVPTNSYWNGPMAICSISLALTPEDIYFIQSELSKTEVCQFINPASACTVGVQNWCAIISDNVNQPPSFTGLSGQTVAFTYNGCAATYTMACSNSNTQEQAVADYLTAKLSNQLPVTCTLPVVDTPVQVIPN